MRAVIYARFSTDKQREESIEAQERACREYAAAHGYSISAVYADRAASGKTDRRPDFQRMMRDAKSQRFDVVLVHKYNRFARRMSDHVRYEDKLNSYGIQLIAVAEDFGTGKEAVIMKALMRSLSEYYIIDLSDEVKKGHRENAMKALHNGGLAPFGYDIVDQKYVVNEFEAAYVRRMYNCASDCIGFTALVDEMAAAGVRGKRGKPIKYQQIYDILRNEKYCGDCILQKTVTVDCISKTRKANQGEAPMYIVENNHPAIISREVFNRAQEELSRRNSLRLQSDKTAITANGRYSKYALTEVLHCAECGSRYKRVTWSIHGKKKIVWRCVSRLDYGKKYCKKSITVEEATLHGAIVRALNRFHVEDESTYLTLMKATIGEAIGINGGSEEIDLLTRRIDALNKRMLDLVNETVAAGKDVESSEDEFKGISDQIEQLDRRIVAIQESIHKDGSRQARLEEIQSIIAKRSANETQYDDSIVRQMIECIKVHSDGRLTIIFGGGYEIKEVL